MHTKPEVKDNLGQILQEAREKRGIKAEALAEKFDISVRHLSSVENNHGKLSYWKLFDIIRYFGIDANTIFYPELNATTTSRQQLYHMLEICDEDTIDYLLKILLAFNDLNQKTSNR